MLGALDIALRMSAQVETDIDTVREDLNLGVEQTDRLIRAVTGYVPGNPNIPVYQLCKGLTRADVGVAIRNAPDGFVSPHELVALKLSERALFQFFLQMDACSQTLDVLDICSVLTVNVSEQDFSNAVRSLATLLRTYRSEHLPMHKHRTKFSAIRQYLGERSSPDDGDAMKFWSLMADYKDWQRYQTAAGAIIDYAQHCKTHDAAAADLHGSPEFTENIAESAGVGDGEGVRLLNALEAIEASPLKIFKDTETKQIYRLVHLGHYTWGWPRTGLTVWGYQPVQNGIVQDLRDRGFLSEADLEGRLQDVPGSRDVLSNISVLHALCQDGLSLILEVGKTLGKFPKDAKPLEEGWRQLMRRASFKDRSPEEIWHLLEEVGPHLVELQEMLGRIIKHWSRLIDRQSNKVDAESILFQEVLKRIYPVSDASNG